MTYTTDKRHEYDPGPCPKCGGTDVHVNWVDVSVEIEGHGSSWMPGQFQCLNPSCEWGPLGIPSGNAGEVWESKFPRSEEFDVKSEVCPHCGSTNITHSLAMFPPKHCRSCGDRWAGRYHTPRPSPS